jgi:site-specific DNA-cytosine methylase
MYYLMEEIKDPIIIANPHGYYEGGEYPETSPAVRSSAFQANTAVAESLPAAARPRAAGDWHTSQHRQTLELGDPAAANSVTSVAKDSMIVEPAILQQQRTEEGKEIRRQHKGDKGIPYAHKELSPRGDGITNTLSTVKKDNLLAEPAVIEDFYPDRPARVYEEQAPTIRSDRTGLKVTEPAVEQVCNLIGDREGKFANPQRGRIDSPAGLAPAVDTAQGGNLVAKIIEQAKTAHPSRGIIMIKNTPCWVRRLTERELFRLMDVDENDIDTLLNAGISNTQLAKLAGNSVVCACYYHIFRKLFIDTNANENEQLQLF